MREKIVWILIAVMALAFLYLKIKQAVAPSPASSPALTPTLSQRERGVEESTLLQSEGGVEESGRVVNTSPLPAGEVQGEGTMLRIGDTQIIVEIADTDAKRSQGLSGRPALAEDRGVLFIMDEAAIHYFWMKDMRFPLDIIWIRDRRIVDISENVPAPAGDEAPMVVHPSEPADQVLEVNAGFAQAHSIEIGNAVRLEI